MNANENECTRIDQKETKNEEDIKKPGNTEEIERRRIVSSHKKLKKSTADAAEITTAVSQLV